MEIPNDLYDALQITSEQTLYYPEGARDEAMEEVVRFYNQEHGTELNVEDTVKDFLEC